MLFALFMSVAAISILLTLARHYFAGKNKTYDQPFTGKYAVMVAVYSEPAEVFERSLKSILAHSRPEQLIIAVDNSDNTSPEMMAVIDKYATVSYKSPERVGKRCLYAHSIKLVKPEVDIVVTVDSDTIWDETTTNILKPFNDPQVGAVGGVQKIFDADKNIIRRIAQWVEDIRALVDPFQSFFGEVNIIFGRTLAARADLYKQLAPVNHGETFMGRRIITSDDGAVTMGVLGLGYKTVHQKDSTIYTDAPNDFRGLFRQYLRWNRGSFRRFIHRFDLMIRMNPLITLSNIDYLLFSTLGLVVIVLQLPGIFTGNGQEALQSWSVILAVAVASLLSAMPRLRGLGSISNLGACLAFMLVVMPVIKLLAMFSFFENGWMTRNRATSLPEGRVVPTRILALLFGSLSLAVMLFVGISLRGL